MFVFVWYAVLCVLSYFTIILNLVALLLLSYACLVTVLWLFLGEPWLGLRCVIGVFPDNTHLRFESWAIA